MGISARWAFPERTIRMGGPPPVLGLQTQQYERRPKEITFRMGQSAIQI